MFSVIGTIAAGYVVSSFILLRRPSLIHAKKRFPFTARHISHRGGAGENIENSKEAFTHASETGTDMFELDCHLTKDMEVVVLHDKDLLRCTGSPLIVNEVEFDSLPKYLNTLSVQFEPGEVCDKADAPASSIALLRDIFGAFPNVAINIDIKDNDDRLICEVSSLIDEFKRHKRTIWGGMNRHVSYKCRRLNPTVLTYPPIEHVVGYLLSYWVGLLPFLPLQFDCMELPLFSILREKGFFRLRNMNSWWKRAFLCVADYLIMSPGLYQHLRRRGIPVFTWVANTDRDFQLAFDLGSSGVMTDYPTLLRAFLDRHPQAGVLNE